MLIQTDEAGHEDIFHPWKVRGLSSHRKLSTHKLDINNKPFLSFFPRHFQIKKIRCRTELFQLPLYLVATTGPARTTQPRVGHVLATSHSATYIISQLEPHQVAAYGFVPDL